MNRIVILLVLLFAFARMQAQKAAVLLEQAETARAKWQKEEATEALDALVTKYRKNPEYLLRRAQIMADFSEFQEAAEDCRDLLGLPSLTPELRRQAAYVYCIVLLCQDEQHEARELLSSEWPLNSEMYDNLTLAGNFFYLMGDNETAFKYYNQAVDMTPGRPEAIYWKGLLMHEMGKTEEAKVFFRRNIQIEEQAGLIYLSCYSYIHLGEAQKGLALLDKISPEIPLDYYQWNLPSLNCFAGRPEEAMDALNQIWDQRDHTYYHYLKLSGDLDCMRDKPAFRLLYEEVFPPEE